MNARGPEAAPRGAGARLGWRRLREARRADLGGEGGLAVGRPAPPRRPRQPQFWRPGLARSGR